ncbi:kinase-like protein [Gonapodya prolifera JEL478]|uniref:Kinase-like protein n=1 Tax=Gonapodya prolifera (strain JEL478) TaxID=1344416 RepID=A0A138ZY83_GONPJ|nr:kinase-like protein [Gonapodya prolifera JEL478]|eukprot:KXS09468.1 kinase-like protein [Gonapodya prolifera JEL478]
MADQMNTEVNLGSLETVLQVNGFIANLKSDMIVAIEVANQEHQKRSREMKNYFDQYAANFQQNNESLQLQLGMIMKEVKELKEKRDLEGTSEVRLEETDEEKEEQAVKSAEFFSIDFNDCTFEGGSLLNAITVREASSGRWKGVLGRWQGIDIMAKSMTSARDASADAVADKNSILTTFRELLIWTQLHHPSILPIYGVGSFEPEPDRVVTFAVAPLIKYDLMSYIKSHKSITMHSKLRLMHDIANGLKVLHGKSFVHTNVKPQNILVTDNGRAMISDFSLALSFSEASNVEKVKEHPKTHLYASPERLRGENGIDPTDDVYSFAIVCAAIWRVQDPPYVCDGDIDEDFLDEIQNGTRPDSGTKKFEHMPKLLEKLIHDCWDATGKPRPTFAQVVERLDEIMEVLDLQKFTEAAAAIIGKGKDRQFA